MQINSSRFRSNCNGETAGIAQSIGFCIAEYLIGDAFAPTFSSITVGGVALTIISEPEGRGEGPSVTTAATGTDLIEGPLRPVRIRNIVGYGPNAGRADFDTLLAWYDSIVTTRPTSGTWWPTSPPTAEPEGLAVGGAKSSRWVISLQLRLIA